MTFEKQFVVTKLNELEIYVDELADILQTSDENILKDLDKLRHSERAFQLAVDTMLDINQHFIRELGLPVSNDFQSTFYALGENNILSGEFADKIAPIVGLRNRIVHRYETINRKRFLANLRKNFEDFKTYTKLITEYINQKQ